jgi:hypothetical protein
MPPRWRDEGCTRLRNGLRRRVGGALVATGLLKPRTRWVQRAVYERNDDDRAGHRRGGPAFSSAGRRKTRPQASVTPPPSQARPSAKRRKLLERAPCPALCLPNAEETSKLPVQPVPRGLLNALFLRDAEENAAAGQRHALRGGTPLREAEETPRAGALLGDLPPQCGGNEQTSWPTGTTRADEHPLPPRRGGNEQTSWPTGTTRADEHLLPPRGGGKRGRRPASR